MAPAAYDGFGTEDLGTECYEANRGRPWRKVRIDPRHYDWQTMRYASGMFGTVDKAELDKLALHGLVTWQHPGTQGAK
jgi:hypothetical protein